MLTNRFTNERSNPKAPTSARGVLKLAAVLLAAVLVVTAATVGLTHLGQSLHSAVSSPRSITNVSICV